MSVNSGDTSGLVKAEEKDHTIPQGRTYGTTPLTQRQLFHEDVVTCPSCNGRGTVPKTQQSELVALIPMKDGRLKPRRTFVYVSLAIFACCVVAGLLLFFLMARSVKVESNLPFLVPSFVVITPSNGTVQFTLQNPINVTNENYFTTTVISVSIQAQLASVVVGKGRCCNKEGLSALNQETLMVPVSIVLIDSAENPFVKRCSSSMKWEHNLYMYFDVLVTFRFLGRQDQVSRRFFQKVSCHVAES